MDGPSSSFKKECWAEFLGTFLLVFLGAGAVSLTALSPSLISLSIVAVTFGGVVAVVVMTLGRISGAHINPAVTIAQTLAGRLNRNKILPYVAFQLAGGLLAGFALRTIFPPDASSYFLGSTRLTSNVDLTEGFLLETVCTFILALVILQVASGRLPLRYQAAIVGSTLFLLILVDGPLTGASLNPARSIGPSVASGYLENLWLYIAAPAAGGVLAALVKRRE